ncbi:MAG: TetR/AcrR family transcriptional regulator [Pseudomonadota bacterium]
MAPGKIGRPKGGPGDTRQRIYETAIPMFIKKGYDNVSIDDICRRMGLTKGAFYAHFKSKDQLVVERILAVDKYYREEIFPALADLETAADKLLTFCRLVFRYMDLLGKKVINTAYYIQIGPNPKVSGAMTEKRELYRIVEELIDEGRATGEFRGDISGTELTQTVMHNIRGVIYDWCLPHSRFDLEEAGEIMLRVLCAGLRSGDAGQKVGK